MNIVSVIISPVITEKSMQDAAKGKFTFVVAKSASKDQVKKVVEEEFKVNVVDIATITVKGRTIRVGKKRTEKKVTSWKKAVVALKAGQKIDLFDLGEKK